MVFKLSSDQDILLELEKEKVVVFTPARRVGGKRVVCYDDRYIIKLAAATGGIVVSNDHYKDLVNENPDFKKVIEERLLMYSFVNDRSVTYSPASAATVSFSFILDSYGVFTLPDTETDTETETDTKPDELTQNPVGIFVGVGLCAVQIPSQNSIQPIFLYVSVSVSVSGSVKGP